MKNIIKRIFIGVAIALIMMFIRQNVYAYEWTTEGDEQLSVVGYGMANNLFYMNYSRRDSAGNFPFTINGSSVSYGFYQNDESGTPTGTVSNLNRIYGATYITGLKLSLANYPFTTGNNYYAIFAFGYDSDGLTSIANNFDEDKILDSSTYSVLNSSGNVNENVVIDSVGFVFGSSNEIESVSSYPYMYYYKINFHVIDDTDEVYFLINTSQTQNITYTAYNTTTFDNYLTKFNFSCTSYNTTVSSCSRYYTRYYKPFLYTHVEGSFIPDPNVSLEQTTDDIKSKIDDIIDGVFSEDNGFPHVFDGSGISFGNYTFQDLLLMPFDFLKSVFTDNNVCSGVAIPFPGIANQTITLPCFQSFFRSFLGDTVFFLVQLILSVTIGFKILYALWKSCLHIFSPDHFIWVDDIF